MFTRFREVNNNIDRIYCLSIVICFALVANMEYTHTIYSIGQSFEYCKNEEIFSI